MKLRSSCDVSLMNLADTGFLVTQDMIDSAEVDVCVRRGIRYDRHGVNDGMISPAGSGGR